MESAVLSKLLFCYDFPQVGVVGRTGAGKSSLMAALFRLAEPKGTVRIDAVPITDISRYKLRRNLSIIPQVRRFFINIHDRLTRDLRCQRSHCETRQTPGNITMVPPNVEIFLHTL